MPRMRKDDNERRTDNFKACLAGLTVKNRLLKRDLREAAGLSRTRYFEKENDPTKFTLKELCGIANELNVSVVTLVEAWASDR